MGKNWRTSLRQTSIGFKLREYLLINQKLSSKWENLSLLIKHWAQIWTIFPHQSKIGPKLRESLPVDQLSGSNWENLFPSIKHRVHIKKSVFSKARVPFKESILNQTLGLIKESFFNQTLGLKLKNLSEINCIISPHNGLKNIDIPCKINQSRRENTVIFPFFLEGVDDV